MYFSGIVQLVLRPWCGYDRHSYLHVGGITSCIVSTLRSNTMYDLVKLTYW